MRRWILILLVVGLVAGCASQKPMKDILLPVNEQWISRYGDNNETALGYNVRVLLHKVREQERLLQKLRKEVDLIIERDNDVKENGPEE